MADSGRTDEREAPWRGALTLVQSAAKSSSGELREALKALNATFPAQMVAATDPDYEQKLLDKIS